MPWPEKGNPNMLLWQAILPNKQQQCRPNLSRLNLDMFDWKTFPLQFSTCNEVVKIFYQFHETRHAVYSNASLSVSPSFAWKKNNNNNIILLSLSDGFDRFFIMVQFVFAQFQTQPKSFKLVLTQGLIQLVGVRNERQSRPSLKKQRRNAFRYPSKELAGSRLLFSIINVAGRSSLESIRAHFGIYILGNKRKIWHLASNLVILDRLKAAIFTWRYVDLEISFHLRFVKKIIIDIRLLRDSYAYIFRQGRVSSVTNASLV